MNSRALKLRLCSTEDADEVYALVQKTIRSCYATCYTSSVTEAFCRYHSYDTIATDIANAKVYVLEDGGRIVGTATLDGSYIVRVYVVPEEQGKGFGTLLMDAMEKLAAKNGSVVTLDASVPGRDLYVRHGYAVTRIETWEIEPFNDLPADSLAYEIMEKRLR